MGLQVFASFTRLICILGDYDFWDNLAIVTICSESFFDCELFDACDELIRGSVQRVFELSELVGGHVQFSLLSPPAMCSHI